jgi:uncharacterized membrane protein
MNIGLIAFACTLILQPIAQILEKKGMSQIGDIANVKAIFSIRTIGRIITNPYIVSGVAVAVISLFLWLIALSKLKVSYIFPLGAIAYIVLVVLAHFILHEQLTLIKYIGVAVIILGAYLINL